MSSQQQEHEDFMKRRDGEDDAAYIARLDTETRRLRGEGDEKFRAGVAKGRWMGTVFFATNIALVIYGLVFGWRTWITIMLSLSVVFICYVIIALVRALQHYPHAEQLIEEEIEKDDKSAGPR